MENSIIQFRKDQKVMAFFYFAPNAFSLIQNLQINETYETQTSSMISPLNQQFYEIYPWNQCVPTEMFSIHEKQISILQYPTNDHNYESQVNITVDRKQNEKKQRKDSGQQKQILSAKKNSQSNIINQLFSFFSSKQKSEHFVMKIIKVVIPSSENHKKVLSLFYNTFRVINIQRGRKYINRKVILNNFTPQMMMESIPQIVQKINEIDNVNFEELCQIFRRCCHSFLRNISTVAILTSKRISGISKQHHLQKRRKILKSILQC